MTSGGRKIELAVAVVRRRRGDLSKAVTVKDTIKQEEENKVRKGDGGESND